MSSQDTPTFIQKALENIIIQENIEDAEIILECGPGKGGDGYLGTMYKFQIKGSKNLKLIAKCASDNLEVRKFTPLRESFMTEIYIYEKVMPWFYKFQNENFVDRPICVPKCYWSSNKDLEEILVFENIKELGYENFDRLQPMDAMHIEMVLKEYSKLHALSLATKEQHPKMYYEIAEELGDNFRNWLEKGKLLQTIKILCERNACLIDKVARNDFYNSYIDLCNNVESFFLDYNYLNDPYAVVTHADCWSNNMMFKYEENKIADMTLLDFQLSKCCTLISDVSFFLYACTDDTIWSELYSYLDIYYSSLSHNLKQLGSDPEKIMPQNVFYKQYKQFARYGLMASAFWMRVNLMENDEAPDIQEGSTFVENFLTEKKNEHIYLDRFKKLLNHFYEYNLLENDKDVI